MWVYNYTIEVSMELQKLSPENRPLIGLTVLCVPPGQTFPKFLDHPSISPSKTSRCLKTLTGWWYTYPSEKYEFVKWEYYYLLFPIYGKSFKIPWFQSPPSRYIVIPMINHYYP
jgi:hypothetical protein